LHSRAPSTTTLALVGSARIIAPAKLSRRAIVHAGASVTDPQRDMLPLLLLIHSGHHGIQLTEPVIPPTSFTIMVTSVPSGFITKIPFALKLAIYFLSGENTPYNAND
jgi:hypothetical protein